MLNLIGTTDALHNNATIVGQIVNFSGRKTFHKISIDATVTAIEPRKIIVGDGDYISFQAANFHRSRHNWVFQPVFHWIQDTPWTTTGTTIQNTLQFRDYSTQTDIAENAPYLEYDIYFPEAGTYDLWCFGKSDTAIYWSFNNDENHLHSAIPGGDPLLNIFFKPIWTRFGNVMIDEAGVFSFKVYLGLSNSTILDQWLFTKNYTYSDDLTANSTFNTPITNSKSSFNTVVRLRNLQNGELNQSSNGIAAWGHSGEILSSGRLNYLLQNNTGYLGVDFEDGVSIEFWQIGGDQNCFCSWNYSFVQESQGNVFKSDDWGQTF